MSDEVIQEHKKHIDRTLIRRSPRMTPEERAQRLQPMAKVREELHRGMERARQPRVETR